MSKVKKKPVRNKAPAKRSRAKQRPSHVDMLQGRLGPALAAAFIVASVAGALILWSGGYIGMMAESVDRTINASVAATGLKIRRITVIGQHQVANDDLLDAVGPVLGDSILHFDPSSARARIEDIGWVRSAAVTRLLPNTISISIRERKPAAVWQMEGALHLIDSEGAVISEIGAYEYSQLPLIVGAGAPETASGLVKALEAAPELEKRVSALVRVAGRRWNLRLKNGMDVKLPEADFAAAINVLEQLHAAHGTLDADFEYIDLRDRERTIFHRKNEAAEMRGNLGIEKK